MPPLTIRTLACLAAGVCGLLAEDGSAGHVLAVRHWSLGDVTRVAIETDSPFEVHSDRLRNPERLFFDIVGTRPALGPGMGRSKGQLKIPVDDQLVRQIRVAEPQRAVTRVVLDLEGPVEFTTSRLENPTRLIIEVHRLGYAAQPVGPKAPPIGVNSSPAEVGSSGSANAPVDINPLMGAPPKVNLASAPPTNSRALQSVQSLPATPPPPPPPLPAKTNLALLAKPTAPAPSPLDMPRGTGAETPPAVAAKRDSSGDRSMTRVLGLKIGRIVLDPGHGGQDAGTIGPNGLREKDLVLDIAHRLGALIEERLNSEVIYARNDDSYVSLERRTQIANEAKADLFLSIHANSSPERTASGVETYYLSFTTSREALDVAARENATSQRSVYELQDLLQKIALKDKVDESREFAARVEDALYSNTVKTNVKVRDRGVKKAPFVVLIGASMPSILAEIGFISNPRDEAQMMRPETRQKVAEALYKGLASYAGTLSHFQVAQRQ
jgi:N-acetylmuramoyl-L-alanine amidase